MLRERVEGARVLDLYAGTGALGFEALSRGASHVTFVEAHRTTAMTLRRAAETFGVAEQSEIVTSPAERAAKLLAGRYDLVLADPPYVLGFPAPVFAALTASGAIDPSTTVVLEHAGRAPVPATPGFTVERTARYGDVALSFLRADGTR
jgi:16S rRNA (guanine966-N2)-methyltransferase